MSRVTGSHEMPMSQEKAVSSFCLWLSHVKYFCRCHIKLGLMKNLVEAIGQGNACSFHYPTEKFPNISGAKMNEGLFIGPQIKSILQNEGFKQSLSTAEFKAWEELKWLCKNFLGIHKFSAYMEGVQLLLDSYQKLGCRMSLKINTLPALRPRVLSRKSCHGE